MEDDLYEHDYKIDYDYQFPEGDEVQELQDKLRKFTVNELLDYMRDIQRDVASSGQPYSDIRLEVCCASLVLNELGLSPAFRPMRKLNRFKGLTEDEISLSRDCQVLDLHYLHSHHRGEFRPARDFKEIFASRNFNFKRASQFATIKWTAAHKAKKVLKLSEKHQKKVAMFRTKKIRDRVSEVDSKARDMEDSLIQYVHRPKSKKSMDDIPLLLDYFVGLKLAGGSPSEAVEYICAKTAMTISEGENSLRNFREKIWKTKKWFQETMDVVRW